MDHNKILCINILQNNKCSYGKKCVYAHSLETQTLSPYRKMAYDIINSQNNLKCVNLIDDNELLENLIKLTKVCMTCNNKRCPGGYNCRHGAIDFKHKICYDDLIYGDCKRKECKSIHLTTRGLIPKQTQQNIKEIKKHANETKHIKSLNNITNILLSHTFFPLQQNHADDTSSSDSNNTQDVIDYLNDNDSD